MSPNGYYNKYVSGDGKYLFLEKKSSNKYTKYDRNRKPQVYDDYNNWFR